MKDLKTSLDKFNSSIEKLNSVKANKSTKQLVIIKKLKKSF